MNSSIRLMGLSRSIRLEKPIRNGINLCRSRLSTVASSDNNIQVEEVRIRVPWGDVTGKWWGPKNTRPILTLHGWLENAGAFDRLIPLLPKQFSYLAIDLPGHGYSSRFPNGCAYTGMGLVRLVEYIRRYFNWKSVSLLTHSLSSLVGFSYCTILPEHCDLMIGIDGITTPYREPDNAIKTYEDKIMRFWDIDFRNTTQQQTKGRTYEELRDLLIMQTQNSISAEVAHHILDRGLEISRDNPEKYCYTRDNRWVDYDRIMHEPKVWINMAGRVNCPYLLIECDKSYFFEKNEFPKILADTIKQKMNDKFEYHLVKGLHHVHLTNPEIVSGIISNFLTKKYSPKTTVDSKL